MTATPPPPTRSRLRPMRPRNPDEPGRSASTLELFFDLVFVVAVSIASVQLAEQLTEGHIGDGIVSYLIIFFGIWWAWMNFTWFATSFDTDDWLYRLLTVVQMGGVLVVAGGIRPVFEERDFTIVIVGYVVMRLALVAQWIRASGTAHSSRSACRIYAVGVSIVQLLWISTLLLPEGAYVIALPVLVLAEVAVPVIAERTGNTPWNPHHITERYGLFTLILLGESLLASSNAIIEAIHDADTLAPLISIAVLTLVATAALWWIYFWPPHHEVIGGLASSLAYGYGHYFIFAAAGAFSAGIEVEIAVITGESELHQPYASFAYTIPIAVFILGIWLIAIRPNADRIVNIAVPLGGILVLIDPLLPVPFALTAVILVGVVIVLVWRPPLGVKNDDGTEQLPERAGPTSS